MIIFIIITFLLFITLTSVFAALYFLYRSNYLELKIKEKEVLFQHQQILIDYFTKTQLGIFQNFIGSWIESEWDKDEVNFSIKCDKKNYKVFVNFFYQDKEIQKDLLDLIVDFPYKMIEIKKELCGYV